MGRPNRCRCCNKVLHPDDEKCKECLRLKMCEECYDEIIKMAGEK